MRAAITLAGLALLAACGSTKVGVDHDRDYDFSGVSTYAWTEGVPAENELNERRIVEGVEAQLTAKGLRKVEADADLLVRTEAGGRQEVRSSGGGVSFGVSRGISSHGAIGVSSGSGNRVYEVTVGTLVISLLDGRTKALVWRAEAEQTLSSDPADTADKIAAAIARAFERYPPE